MQQLRIRRHAQVLITAVLITAGGINGADRLLHFTCELSVRELEFMAQHEQIGHLINVLVRRTPLAFRGLVTGELLNEVAGILAGPLGRDAATRAREITHAQEVLQRFHGVRVPSLVA